jgi:glutamyl-tRNA synthetase
MSVRTRFAPSPSGFLHLGGARTALFNWLFARHHRGAFVLRIEDTDRDRSTTASVDAILDALGWLGLDWDEGPFFQSERADAYARHLAALEASGHVYRCWCRPEELEAKREAARAAGRSLAYDRTCRDRRPPPGDPPSVLRFRTPTTGGLRVDDAVKGPITFALADLDDFVVARSDGSAVYNFCVTIDDVDMAITDVIRGDDHLTNTPRQVLLYDALGASRPRFAHVPMILGQDRTRLSKRHGATSVTAYRDLGYLPDAMVNYLARLGWAYGDQEIFSRAELVDAFGLAAVGRSAAVFDPEKLAWVNFQWMKAADPATLLPALAPLLEHAGIPVPADRAWLARAVTALQERARTLGELAESLRIYCVDEITWDPDAVRKHLRPAIAPAFDDLRARLAALGQWSPATIETTFADVIAAHGLRLGKLAQPVRVAVTGTAASPGIFEVLALLGRERSLARLAAARARFTPDDARAP